MTVRELYRSILPKFDSNQVNTDIDYKMLVETASDIVFVTDPQGYFTYANRSTEVKFGFQENELIGRHLLDFVHDDFKNQVFDFYREQYRHKTTKTNLSFPITIHNGGDIWIEINVKSILRGGKITGFMGVAWDVTQKVKTATTLRAINSLAKQLLGKSNLHDIIWTITHTTMKEFGLVDCVIYLVDEVEGKLRQIAAYGPKNVKERQIEEPLTLEIGEGIVGDAALTGNAQVVNDTSNDARYIVDDEFRFAEMAVPIIHENEVIGVIDSEHPDKGFFTDEHLESITTVAGLVAAQLKSVLNEEGKQRAEKELKESEERLRSIVNSSMDAIITFDEQGQITEWNPQASVIFGISKVEASGQDFIKLLIAKEHAGRLTKGLLEFTKSGDKRILDQRLELTGLYKNNKKVPLEITLIATSSTNNSNFISAFIRDISLQIESKKEIEKALQKEKEVSELRSKFISLASHEFRTPLTTIQTSVDLLKLKLEDAEEPDFEACGRNLNRIENEVDRLTKYIGDLLNLGKVDADISVLALEPIDMVVYSQKIIDDHFSQQKDMRIVEVHIEGKPLDINIDKEIFTHVLINLISNSFKYCAEAHNTILTLKYEEDHFIIIVADRGIGINEEDIPHLFNSFYRGRNTADIQGTGLGLFIVKQFVEMHNGEIEVKSDLGKGSQFILKLNYI